MKKYLAFLSVILMLALAGCGQEGEKASNPPAGDSKAPVSDTAEPTSEPTPEPTLEPAASNKVVDYKLDLPEGFEPIDQPGMEACWYNGADQSNVNLGLADRDATTDLGFKTITADLLRTTLEAAFKAEGMEVELKDRYFTKDEVCGLPAYQYSYEMELDGGQHMTQIVVCINADKTYTFTFTTSSSDMVPVFDESAKNIQLTLE